MYWLEFPGGGRVVETISLWLDRVGLPQYTRAFELNEITFEIASTLSDADLIELGVKPLGHRRLLSAAIAALRDNQKVSKPTPLERRHLTVMFCDLVGSTVLSTKVDPEELANIIGAYERLCTSVIARYDGFIARYLGDGVLLYFGYPVAHEDDAERAIRSALDIVKEIGTLKTIPGEQLRVRIGIASGPVVVGDLGDGGANRDAVIGQTPNLAARLQGFAGENEIVIADSTYSLAGSLFRCSALGKLAIRGFDQPMKAWRVVSERRYRGRFEARHKSGLTPFVGRESEFETLAENWRAVAEKSGRVVSVTGEAGIGKSRLVRQFTTAISQHRHRLLTYFGSPHLQNSPFRPIIHQLEQEARIGSMDTPSVRRVKLEALLSSTPGLASEAAPILSRLLSLPRDHSDPDPDPDPRRDKRQTLDMLIRWLEARAAIEPIVCICEDVHWFDPTSKELLEAIMARIAKLPMLLVLTFRSEFRPTWAQSPIVRTMQLDRLNAALGAQIVENVAAQSNLSASLMELIVAKCDGVPLFIEELTKTVLESHAAEPVEEADAHLAIPDSLQDSLVARLDRLTGVKEVAQVGAAIGREFRLDLLAAVSGIGQSDLRSAVTKLADADLITQRDTMDGTIGVFKHALVQDAIYETLLHAKRRSTHRRIAEALEESSSETRENQPEVLAFHWEKAGVPATAVRYLTWAGKRAASRSATTEASMHFRQGLRICSRLPEGRERDELELEAALQHGGVLRATQGPHSSETGEAFARARDICLRIGNEQDLFPSLSGLFGYYLVGAQNEQAEKAARSLLEVAEARQDRFYKMVGHRAVGMVHLHTGEPREARMHLEQSLALYNVRSDGPSAFSYGTDHAQTAASFLALTLWVLGYVDQAAAREQWAVTHGSRLNHRYSLVQTAMFRIKRGALARDWDTVQILAEETYKIALEHSFPLAAAMSRFYLAVCRATRGEASEALLHELEHAVKAQGRINYHPFYLSLIAEAHAAAGDIAGGLRLLSVADSVTDATQEYWTRAELLRLRGEMMLALSPLAIEPVERLFIQAVEIAEKQGARTWHLRSVVSWARLLSSSGRTREARNQLSALYSTFREGMGSPDLLSARTLLEELAEGPSPRGLEQSLAGYHFW